VSDQVNIDAVLGDAATRWKLVYEYRKAKQAEEARAALAELIAERDALRHALKLAKPIVSHAAAGRRGMRESAALALPRVDAALARTQKED